MFNRKVEALPRSVQTAQEAIHYSQFERPGVIPPIDIDYQKIELSIIFAEEERLAARIAKPNLIDKETIDKVIAVAKEIAAAGYSLRLVELDDLLDIAQIFAADATKAANLLFELVSTIKETGNTAWTAHVAAVLAYYSVPQSA